MTFKKYIQHHLCRKRVSQSDTVTHRLDCTLLDVHIQRALYSYLTDLQIKPGDTRTVVGPFTEDQWNAVLEDIKNIIMYEPSSNI